VVVCDGSKVFTVIVSRENAGTNEGGLKKWADCT
jgi:hypothetical protein